MRKHRKGQRPAIYAQPQALLHIRPAWTLPRYSLSPLAAGAAQSAAIAPTGSLGPTLNIPVASLE